MCGKVLSSPCARRCCRHSIGLFRQRRDIKGNRKTRLHSRRRGRGHPRGRWQSPARYLGPWVWWRPPLDHHEGGPFSQAYDLKMLERYISAYRLPSLLPKYTTRPAITGDERIVPTLCILATPAISSS